jgi:hypothetical protein
MKRLSVILVSFLLYLPLSAQFKGTVYVDTDQSGLFNKGDKPLAGVMVTDGLNVVKTDKKGRFSLPGFDKTRFISITTPAGFETEQFYLSTKENRKSYDFILTDFGTVLHLFVRTDKSQGTFFRSNHRYRSDRWNGTLGN